MLTGDAPKFYGLLFGIAFSTLLITQQMTVFISLIERGASGVYNAPEAEVWVMDPVSRTTDVSYAMPPTALDKVRSVKGVEWAVPHLRATAAVRTSAGDLEGCCRYGPAPEPPSPALRPCREWRRAWRRVHPHPRC
jgi:putative ABC transport system permease protein